MRLTPIPSPDAFPQGIATVARGDILYHHSRPGAYVVEDVTHDGHIVLLDPRAERQRVWKDYVALNFTRVLR